MDEWSDELEEVPSEESDASVSDDNDLSPEEEAFMQGYEAADEIASDEEEIPDPEDTKE